MGFSFASPLSTQSGSRQSQSVAATNPAVDIDTGTITAASNWSTVRRGQAFAVVRSGAVVAVRCIASASTTTLTYYRLYLESGEELPTDIQVGDTIEVCEQPNLVGAGNVLDGNGATLTTTGNFLSYATGTNQLRVSGYLQIPTNHVLLPSPTVATTLTTAALHTFTGGLLVLGEYITQNGVSAFANESLIRHTGAPASPDAAFGLAINACLGVHWFGGTFSGDRVIGTTNQVAAPMTIYSKSAIMKTVTLQTTSSYQFRTPNNLTTYGLTIDGFTLAFIGSNPSVQGLVVQRSVRPVALGGPAPTNQFIPLRGAALKAGNLWYELAMWTSKWYRIINHATGSDCRVGGNVFTSANTSNRGLAEFRQEIRGTLLTKSRTPIVGAKVFIRDTNNGNRLAANQINLNPSYLDDRTYYMTSNSSGVFEFTTDGGVLTAVKYQNLAAVAVQGFEGVVEDYRGPGNSNADLFTYHTVAYGYLPLSLSANLQGTVAKDLSTTLDVDVDITETDLATVLAYTEIDTQAKIYDRAQAWLTESSANQELPGLGNQLVTLANNTLQLGSRSLVVDATAASAFAVTSTTITVKATTLTANIKTTGTVTLANGATIDGAVEDSAGVRVTIRKSGGGNFNIAARYGTTGSYTDLGYTANTGSITYTVPKGQPVEVAMWSLGYMTYRREISTAAGGVVFDAEMTLNSSIDTGLDVSGYLSNISVSNGGGIFQIIFDADMDIPGIEAAKAIVHRIVGLEIPLRAGLPPTGSTIIEILADEIRVNKPYVFLTLGTGATNVTQRGYINAGPALVIDPSYAVNPRRLADNLRVELPLNKPTLDASVLALAVRTELATELGRIDATVSSRLPTAGYTAPAPAADIAAAVEAAILTEGDGRAVLQAIADKIANENLSASTVAAQVRTELAAELSRMDAPVSSRLAASAYTAPTAAPTAAQNAAAVRTNLATELARLDAAVSSRSASGEVVGANVVRINGVELQGAGTAGNSFRPKLPE